MPKEHPYGDYEFHIADRKRDNFFLELGDHYKGFDPMDYCRKLGELVRKGELDQYEANNMWRNYKKSVEMIYVNMPKLPSCTLGPEVQQGYDPGYYDGGFYDPGYYDPGLSDFGADLTAPSAAFPAQEKGFETIDPLTWAPGEKRIDSVIDPFGGVGDGRPPAGRSPAFEPAPAIGGLDVLPDQVLPDQAATADLPAVYEPVAASRPAPRAVRPPWQQPRVEILAVGPDGTYHPVPYVPMPVPRPAPPPEGPPSPYEGVPVTGSFGIKD